MVDGGMFPGMPKKKNPNPRPVGRPPLYPWDRWFDGDSHYIERGAADGYACETKSIQQMIYSRAHELGLKVTARRVHNGIMVKANRDMRRTSTTAKYDWDLLLDGAVHSLVVGKDISAAPASFKVYARQKARERGLGLQIRTMDRNILLKALPKDQEPKRGQPAVRLEPPAPKPDPLSNPRPFVEPPPLVEVSSEPNFVPPWEL